MTRNLTWLLVCLAIAAVVVGVVGANEAISPGDQPASDLFARLDKNGDGYLTLDEFNRPKLFKRADTDKDGRLSLQEARAAFANRKAQKKGDNDDRPQPTHANVKYGPHERNGFDFWQAKSGKPTPLIVFIHGGGFRAGDKSMLPPEALKRALDAGVSVMSVNYRFLPEAPIQDILRDCARAIQYVRANAAKFNIDPKRIGAFGGSAGAGTSLWLATHDDLADPKSEDPVLRESSRLSAAACLNGQATYDLVEWQKIIYPFNQEWLRDNNEILDFYGFKSADELESETGKKILKDCSMYSLLSSDDAPIWMHCSLPGGEPKDRNHILHHPKHCEVIKKRGDEVGAKVEISLHSDDRASAALKAVEFLIKNLGAEKS